MTTKGRLGLIFGVEVTTVYELGAKKGTQISIIFGFCTITLV